MLKGFKHNCHKIIDTSKTMTSFKDYPLFIYFATKYFREIRFCLSERDEEEESGSQSKGKK